MKKKILHTPEGVRDIYNDEYEKKLILENDLCRILKNYGYHSIQTPTFEFFDIFGKEIGTTPSNELYKFVSQFGDKAYGKFIPSFVYDMPINLFKIMLLE